jgi:hypothetical protein
VPVLQVKRGRKSLALLFASLSQYHQQSVDLHGDYAGFAQLALGNFPGTTALPFRSAASEPVSEAIHESSVRASISQTPWTILALAVEAAWRLAAVGFGPLRGLGWWIFPACRLLAV